MRFEDLEIGKLYVENTHDYNEGLVMECVEICKDEANFKVIKGNAYFKENQPLRFGCIYIGTDSFQPLIQTHEEVERVNHPAHYQGKYECIDVMLDVYGEEATTNFCICNAFKYIWRHNHKDGKQDIEKCMWYLKKYMELKYGESKSRED